MSSQDHSFLRQVIFNIACHDRKSGVSLKDYNSHQDTIKETTYLHVPFWETLQVKRKLSSINIWIKDGVEISCSVQYANNINTPRYRLVKNDILPYRKAS